MNDDVSKSWAARAAEKAVSRARDEAMLEAGEVSRGELARKNGGGHLKVRYVGPSKRIQELGAAARRPGKGHTEETE